MQSFSRREFLIKSGKALLGLGAGELLLQHLLASETVYAQKGGISKKSMTSNLPILVVIQLSGGNDGTNSIIPYNSGPYYDLRKNVAIKQEDVLPINTDIGFHPKLTGLKNLFDQRKVAIMQGVGYPNPNRSHFDSMDIWHTADIRIAQRHGWLARYLKSTQGQVVNPLRAIEIGSAISFAMRGEVGVPCIQEIGGYRLNGEADLLHAYKEMYKTNNEELNRIRVKGQDLILSVEQVGHLTPITTYPRTRLGNDLATAATLIKGNLGTQVIYAHTGGYDHHADLVTLHPERLEEFDTALAAFYEDMENSGLADRVSILVFSEFGRRLQENGSLGTDHGAASVTFLIGNRVRGGLYGQYPSLYKLDDGDLRFTMDFRSIYATVIDNWLGGSHEDVLGSPFEKFSLFT